MDTLLKTGLRNTDDTSNLSKRNLQQKNNQRVLFEGVINMSLGGGGRSSDVVPDSRDSRVGHLISSPRPQKHSYPVAAPKLKPALKPLIDPRNTLKSKKLAIRSVRPAGSIMQKMRIFVILEGFKQLCNC